MAEGAERLADKPHSSVLEWAVETGIPGGALFSALCAGILFVVGRILLSTSARGADDWVVAGIWAGATAYAVQSLVTVTAIGVDGVWWVLLGLLAGWSVPAARARGIVQRGRSTSSGRRARSGYAKQSGFTLIELLVVIIIIAILAAIAIPTFLGQREKAQDAAAITLVRNALTVVESANIDVKNYSLITGGQLSAIEPSIVWNLPGVNLVDPPPAPDITTNVVSRAGVHGVDFYGQASDRFDVASLSDSGNRYGIEVVTTGSAGASFIKVKMIDNVVVSGW